MASKRHIGLVDYVSSDDDVDAQFIQQVKKAETVGTLPKRRKLPILSEALTLPQPVDNPRLHQGRVRSVPYAEGQWAAHVYVPVRLNSRSLLLKLIQESLTTASDVVPTLQSFLSPKGNSSEVELHISLSRPVYLRAHQRDDFKRSIKALARSQKPFKLSFASFSIFHNDEQTRAFLALEVGAGHDNLKIIANGLEPTLRSLRQQIYYESPRFHASIAWALLGPLDGDSEPHSRTMSDNAMAITNLEPKCIEKGSPEPSNFLKISAVPTELLPRLISLYGPRLTSPIIGTFEADIISVQIGKEISSWSFTDISA